MISNSSFPFKSKPLNPSGEPSQTPSSSPPAKSVPTRAIQIADPADEANTTSTSLKLFPHFLNFPLIKNTSTHHNHLASTYLGDQSTPPTSPPHPPPSFAPPEPITKPTILICSHGTRDARCGILGPLLYEEFLKHVPSDTVDVGMISHIGGHAFAGNVIIYIPPTFPLATGNIAEKEGETHTSPLAGMGIWYGRVEPRHVQQILEETLEKGNIIGELWRGCLDTGTTGKNGVEDWRARTASARTLRIPSDILERDGMVMEEKGFREQLMDTAQRVEMMGRRAREWWERKQLGST